MAQPLTLKEKQALAELDFNWSKKRISENYGSAVNVRVEPASFAGDMDAILFADSRGAQVAANVIARICDDNLGKEALQARQITEVILINTPTDGRKVSIDNGKITLSFGFADSSKCLGEYDLKNTIESML